MVVLGCIVKLCRNVEAGSVRIPRRCSSNITTQFVTVEDRKIHVAQTGRGDKALLLLPGALGSALSDLKPQLEGLDGEKLTVVGWDPPGYGQSRPPARRWENFFREDAEMAVKTMTALGHHKFSLAGWSDGGITALCAAAKFPHNIDKLVVWGSNAYISQWDIDNIDQVSDVSKWSERMRKPMEEMYGDSFPSLWSGWCQAYKVLKLDIRFFPTVLCYVSGLFHQARWRYLRTGSIQHHGPHSRHTRHEGRDGG